MTVAVDHFTKRFRKIRLKRKWNTTFSVVPAENSPEQWTIWKGSHVSPSEYSKRKFLFYFLKATFVPISDFRSRYRFTEMICEFCLPFTQTLNWPVCPCKWETTGVSCVKLHSPSISIRLAFFWFRMTNNSRWSDFRPTIQQSDMVFTNVSPSSWKLQRRNKKTSFIAFTINKEGKSCAVYSE